MASAKWKVELICFSVLLVLVAAQVVLYKFADREQRQYNTSLDHASVVFYGEQDEEPINVSLTSDNCYQCVPTLLGNLSSGHNLSVLLDTTYSATITMETSNASWECTHHFTESGLYHFLVTVENRTDCGYAVIDHGENSFLPILYAGVVLLVIATVWTVLGVGMRYRGKVMELVTKKGVATYDRRGLVRSNIQTNIKEEVQDPFESMSASLPASSPKKQKKKASSRSASPASILIRGTQEGPQPRPPAAEETKSPCKGRLQSLDTFRGFSLVIMIFVNYGGGGYYFFQHSKWNGLTVADLVFPWFVWIMGVSLVFSFKGRGQNSFFDQLYLIVKRTIILFAFGIFLISNTGRNAGVPLSTLRIAGVLQRLAATYFVTAATELAAQRVYKKVKLKALPGIQDLCYNWLQLCVGLLLTLLWLLLTFLLHYEDCPRGYLGPGGIGDHGAFPNCTGGAATVLDRWILGEKHLYSRSTAMRLYQTHVRCEPEGVLGTLTSVVLCILGVQAGKIVLYYKDNHRDILIRLSTWGMALCGIAALLCLGQKNGGLIPVNKNLWSLSFILLLGGFGYLLLAVFYILVDVCSLWTGAPFKYTGMNSIMIYLGHEILHPYFPFSFYHQNHTHLTFLSSNLIAVSIWVLISYYWFAINFFVKF